MWKGWKIKLVVNVNHCLQLPLIDNAVVERSFLIYLQVFCAALPFMSVCYVYIAWHRLPRQKPAGLVVGLAPDWTSEWQSSQSAVVDLFTRWKLNKLQKGLCAARYAISQNSIRFWNKPRLFEVWIPHNYANMNHDFKRPHGFRENLELQVLAV